MLYLILFLIVFFGLIVRANILQTPVEGYSE